MSHKNDSTDEEGRKMAVPVTSFKASSWIGTVVFSANGVEIQPKTPGKRIVFSQTRSGKLLIETSNNVPGTEDEICLDSISQEELEKWIFSQYRKSVHMSGTNIILSNIGPNTSISVSSYCTSIRLNNGASALIYPDGRIDFQTGGRPGIFPDCDFLTRAEKNTLLRRWKIPCDADEDVTVLMETIEAPYFLEVPVCLSELILKYDANICLEDGVVDRDQFHCTLGSSSRLDITSLETGDCKLDVGYASAMAVDRCCIHGSMKIKQGSSSSVRVNALQFCEDVCLDVNCGYDSSFVIRDVHSIVVPLRKLKLKLGSSAKATLCPFSIQESSLSGGYDSTLKFGNTFDNRLVPSCGIVVGQMKIKSGSSSQCSIGNEIEIMDLQAKVGYSGNLSVFGMVENRSEVKLGSSSRLTIRTSPGCETKHKKGYEAKIVELSTLLF